MKSLILFISAFFLGIAFLLSLVGLKNDNKISKETVKEVPIEVKTQEIIIDNSKKFYYKSDGTPFKVMIIDSCEYLFYNSISSGGDLLTHKGNCKFCEDKLLGRLFGKPY